MSALRGQPLPSRSQPRWRFAWLLAAPHRLAFGAAAALLALVSLWWAFVLLWPARSFTLAWAMAPAQAHGLVMTFGFMPLFFCGFLFTAGPKWLARPPVDADELLPAVLAQVCGWTVFLLGVQGHDAALARVLAAAGLGAAAFGWTSAWWRFVGLLRASRAEDRRHAAAVALAGGLGAAMLWLAAVATWDGDAALVRIATQLGLWGFVGVVYVAVAHRMIPFFTAAAVPVLDAWRPMWLLWALVAAVGFEAAGALAEMLRIASPAWRATQAALELPAGLALLALAWRWGLVQSLRQRLLAMLHLGFVWLGLAFVLAGLSHALQAASDGALTLGVAPLHAYTMGFLGSTLIAMATRVSCGQGGRVLSADDFVWRLFWVLQAAVVARVAAGIVAALGGVGAPVLVGAAALVWCAACVAWALRYGRWYGLPRADGRAG